MGTLILDGGNVKVECSHGDSINDNTGNVGVAIGVGKGTRDAGTVIVNDGSLFASGGALSPGIGGGYCYGGKAANGGTVIVNGGIVTAKGYGGAPAIGGGTARSGYCGKGGDFILNGGTVYAYAYEISRFAEIGRCGAAIGGSAKREANKNEVGGMGSVTINDGTLYAYADVGAAIGHGNITNVTVKIETGSDGAFTIKGGSVKLVSGSGSPLSHVKPINDSLSLTPVTVSATRFGAPPYKIQFVQKDETQGANPFVYRYNGSGYEGDNNLYFYLPYGNYYVNNTYCTVDENGITFPGFLLLIR